MTTEVVVLLHWTVGQLPQIQLDGPESRTRPPN